MKIRIETRFFTPEKRVLNVSTRNRIAGFFPEYSSSVRRVKNNSKHARPN